MWSCSEYQDNPAEMDDFQLLPDDRGWQDTIHFKDEGHRCSILKTWIPSCTYFLRNILRHFRELPQRGRHIQLMELPISTICWLSDYLQPYSSNLTIKEKQEIFSIRNSMVNIPTNFGLEEKCMCGKIESLSHIYECKILNEEKQIVKYEEIYSENIGKIKII